MHSVMIIVNNTVLYTSKLLKDEILNTLMEERNDNYGTWYRW